MGDFESCALSCPGAWPVEEDGEKYYPVTSWCQYASYYDKMQVLKCGKDTCKTCPKYTDRSKTVHIQAGSFRADLFLDRLTDMPVPNLRKLFKLTLSYDWDNEDAIRTMEAHLDAAVKESKQAWADASAAYKDGYRLVKWPYMDPATDVKKATAENARLAREVKQAKARHERWVKCLEVWNDTKAKFL